MSSNGASVSCGQQCKYNVPNMIAAFEEFWDQNSIMTNKCWTLPAPAYYNVVLHYSDVGGGWEHGATLSGGDGPLMQL